MIKENDLLTINYTNDDTSRPKGMMTTQRNAYMNSVGTLVHEHLSCVDRYLRTLPMFSSRATDPRRLPGLPDFMQVAGRLLDGSAVTSSPQSLSWSYTLSRSFVLFRFSEFPVKR
jgi:hypothetical protein